MRVALQPTYPDKYNLTFLVEAESLHDVDREKSPRSKQVAGIRHRVHERLHSTFLSAVPQRIQRMTR